MVKISSDGKVESVFEHFGSKKSSFNPVYDDNDKDISNRIASQSSAPFSSTGMFGKSNDNHKDNAYPESDHNHDHTHSCHDSNSCC